MSQTEQITKSKETKQSELLPTLEGLAELEAALEAILFAAGYPMKYTKLSEVLGLEVADIKRLLEHMQSAFNGEDLHRGIQLLLLPDTAQLCTKERFAPYIREALGVRRGGNLSASSMEVLAVVAYNQPVTRSFIDNVRGVDSSYAVNSLLDKGLIEAVGRLDVVGRPMLYATTDKFLRVFGINSLAELPATEALAVAAQVESQKTDEENAAAQTEQA
jgi:segregation and condensation protein B